MYLPLPVGGQLKAWKLPQLPRLIRGAGIGEGDAIALVCNNRPEVILQLIALLHISHTFLVHTMINRLLRLPLEQREAADISSLRFIIHSAAPCPVQK